MVTVTIEEFEKPSGNALEVEAFDFSVVDEDGEDIHLRGPVSVTLPYTMPEGRNSADVLPVHWNEHLERWESVEGGVVDEADHTVTVEMDHLSGIGITFFVGPLQFLALTAASGVGEDTLPASYENGFKHALTLRGDVNVPIFYGLGVAGGASLILDVDDILSLGDLEPKYTVEGESGFFTYGVNGHFAGSVGDLGGSGSLTITTPFTGKRGSDGYNNDLSFDASISVLSLSLPGGVLEADLLTFNENGNFSPVDAQINVCPECNLSFEVGSGAVVKFLSSTVNIAKGEFNTNFEDIVKDLTEGRCGQSTCRMTWVEMIELYMKFMLSGLVGLYSLGEKVGLLYDYTDFEHISPKDASNIGWGYVNLIEDFRGGHDVNGDGRGDLVFPSDRTEGIPVQILTTGDNLEQKRHFLEVVSITDGWHIEFDESSTHPDLNAEEKKPSEDALLRVDFDAPALALNETHWLITADEDAPVSGQVNLRLVENRSLLEGLTDQQRDQAEIPLWKDKQLSDLSIGAEVDPDPINTDGPATYTVTVENRGPDAADDVELTMKSIRSLGLNLQQATLSASSMRCRETASVGDLVCDLGDIDAGETVVASLKFELNATFPTGTPITTAFAVISEGGGGGPLPKEEIAPLDNSTSVTALTKSDREALTALYNATDGASWTRSDNWVTAAPLDDWRGVETDDRGRVTSLHLVEKGLNGQMPAELGDLTELKWLSLARNRSLTGDIPPELAALTKLEVLYLWENDLTGPLPTWLGDLTKLERVSLGHNRLTGAMPNDLSKLTRVETLYLAGNALSGEIPDWVGDLTGMTRLFLYDNDLEGDVPSTLGNLENLEYLHLRGNDDLMGCLPSSLMDVVDNDFDRVGLDFCVADREALVALYNATGGDNWNDDTNWLSSAPIGEWYGVTTDSDGRVTSLKLSENSLSGPLPSELGDLSELTCLSLWGNDLTGAIPEDLGDLTNLTQLDLLGNGLYGSIPSSLGDLTNLTRLHLAENDLSGSIPSSLGDLTSLESLYLFRNDLRGQIPSSLENLTNLNWLYISENGFTGCVPAGLRDVPNHDLGKLSSLSYCAQTSTSGVVAQDSSVSPQQSADFDVGPRQSADFDADAEDIGFPSGYVYAGDSGVIRAFFRNLSSSTGPHDGEATFDLTIYIEPPSGTATRFSWDNEAFTLNQERTFWRTYTFASAGTYTVYAEVYNNMGQQSGWNSANRFDQLIETFTVNSHPEVTVQFSPSSYTVNEDDGSVDITVTISASPSLDTSVILESRDAQADSPSDYRAVRIILRFDNHTTELAQTVAVTLHNDLHVEGAETFRMELSDVSRNNPSATISTQPAIVTIQDNDEATVGFQNTSYRVNEDSPYPLSLCVAVLSPNISGRVAVPFTVHLSYDDLHGAGLTGPTSLPFDAYDRVRCADYPFPDDNVVENEHTVEFTLDSVTSDSLGVASRVTLESGRSRATLTIRDDDVAFVEFENPSYSVTEGDAAEVCAVQGYGTAEFPFTVNLSYTDPDGVVSSGPTSLTFGARASKSCGDFQTRDDNVAGGSSQVSFSLTRPANLDNRFSLGPAVTLTVIDDESPSNSPPSITSFSPSSTSLTRNVGSKETFEATASDPDDNLAKFEFFVNGQSRFTGPLSLTGPATRRYTRTFSDPGNYAVRVVFTDADGASDSVAWTVRVPSQATTNRAPTATRFSPTQEDVSVPTGLTQTFVARASDPDNNLTSFRWYVNGVLEASNSLSPTGSVTGKFSHRFVKPGSYTVRATLTDSNGLSDSASWDVEVKGPDLTTCAAPAGSSRGGCEGQVDACLPAKQ